MDNFQQLGNDRSANSATETYVPCTCQICGRRSRKGREKHGYCHECESQIYGAEHR